MDARFAVLVWMIVLVAVYRVACDPLDRARIRRSVAQRGGRVRAIAYAPFGAWGDRAARAYRVSYVLEGEAFEREGLALTTMFRGVWWKSDAPPGVPARM